MEKKRCPAYQTNRHVPNFTCHKGLGHTDAHSDPRTGMGWKYPRLPYGMRRPRGGK